VTDETTFEGWAPEAGGDVSLAAIIDKAFDYRGNVTVVKVDGSEPFVQMFDLDGAGPLTIPYHTIRTIRFTGRDTAAGNSYAAWLRAKEAAKSARRDA